MARISSQPGARRPRRRWLRRILFAFLFLIVGLGAVTALTTHWFETFGARASGDRLARMERSPNFRDGAFVNLVPTTTMVPGTLWTTVKRQFFGEERRTPPATVPIVTRTAADFATPPASGLRATWMGHATVLVEVDGKRVLTDPMWSERASPSSLAGPRRMHPPPIALADLPPIDAVVVSHDHYDHLDYDTIRALMPRTGKFVVPLGIGAHLEAWGVPATQIVELDWNEKAELEGLTLTAVPARHFSGRFIRVDHALWACWVIAGPAHRVFFSGDTGYFEGFREVGAKHGPFDLTLVKIGAYGETWPEIHVDPEQAVRIHEDVRGQVLLPIHWATFNLAWHVWEEPAERVVAEAAARAVKLAMPRPGESVEPGGTLPVATWWRL